MEVSKKYPVIAWWSGGIASAVTCKLCVDWFGAENVRIVFIDTHNEHPDTYRFLKDCEKWYGGGVKVETISNPKYDNIQDVWYDYLSLNVAKGAICSSTLKSIVRQQFIKKNKFSHQAFGYDTTETQRAKDMLESNPHLRPIFPLLASWIDKKECVRILQRANTLFLSIPLPEPYLKGYNNNNCFETGCVQGGIGYWQKIKADDPQKFLRMANVEHELTDLKGEPVTMLRDQANDKKAPLFLIKHPKYPDIPDISTKKGMPVEPLADCNGFCSTDKCEAP